MKTLEKYNVVELNGRTYILRCAPVLARKLDDTCLDFYVATAIRMGGANRCDCVLIKLTQN